MQLSQLEPQLQSNQPQKEKFLAKRSFSMKIPYQRYAFVPTMHPKKKEGVTSPLHLIKTIDEDKEGGYSDGEEEKNKMVHHTFFALLQKHYIDTHNQRTAKSSVNLPSLDINANPKANSYCNVKTKGHTTIQLKNKAICSPTPSITTLIQPLVKPQGPIVPIVPIAPPKKRNSILNSLERKKQTIN